MERVSRLIRGFGPISIARFMEEVLIGGNEGYYCKRSPIGRDFITAPEMSQMFGEMVGVWIVNELSKVPRDLDKIQLVELGPGNGVLMQDIIRVMAKFLVLSDVEVHLVEVSPILRRFQKQNITGVNVTWHDNIYTIPEKYSVFIANEFFDALPIRQYVYCKDRTWHEVLICLKGDKLEYVLSPHKTALNRENVDENIFLRQAQFDTVVEISPKTITIATEISEKISKNGGLALICDYGRVGCRGSTFRAYRQHKLSNPLEFVGESDLTADVDFAALKRAFGPRVKYYGPQSQAEFLREMGIEHRLKVLLGSSENEKVLLGQYGMLMDKMGELFKFVAVTDTKHDEVFGFV